MTSVLTQLKLKEISLVDNGANQHARVLLAKRVPEKAGKAKASKPKPKGKPPYSAATAKAAAAFAGCIAAAVAKGYMDGEAETLQEALDEQAERELLDALWSSLCSIFNDDTLSDEQEAAMTQASFDQFMAQLKGNDAAAVAKEDTMPLDLSKAAPEVKAHIEKLEADLKAATAKQADLEKSVAELKAAAPKGDPAEEILKGLTPEAKAVVEKAQKDAAAATSRVQKLEDDASRKEYVAKAATLKKLPAKADELGVALKALAETAPDAYKEIERVLMAANELIEKNDLLMKQLGADGAGDAPTDGSAHVEARAKAQELLKAGTAKTIEQGVQMVYKRDPALYARSREESRAKN
jgi:hypothetical protein